MDCPIESWARPNGVAREGGVSVGVPCYSRAVEIEKEISDFILEFLSDFPPGVMVEQVWNIMIADLFRDAAAWC